MTRYYFAAKFDRNAEMRRYRAELLAAIPGVSVTSRWINERPGDAAACGSVALDTDPLGAWQLAAEDLDDIRSADVLVSFTGPVGRGGRHVEHGYGMALGLRIVCIGGRDHLFHCAPDTEVWATWPEFLAAEAVFAPAGYQAEPAAQHAEACDHPRGTGTTCDVCGKDVAELKPAAGTENT